MQTEEQIRKDYARWKNKLEQTKSNVVAEAEAESLVVHPCESISDLASISYFAVYFSGVCDALECVLEISREEVACVP
jgi:hypothetical protein